MKPRFSKLSIKILENTPLKLIATRFITSLFMLVVTYNSVLDICSSLVCLCCIQKGLFSNDWTGVVRMRFSAVYINASVRGVSVDRVLILLLLFIFMLLWTLWTGVGHLFKKCWDGRRTKISEFIVVSTFVFSNSHDYIDSWSSFLSYSSLFSIVLADSWEPFVPSHVTDWNCKEICWPLFASHREMDGSEKGGSSFRIW